MTETETLNCFPIGAYNPEHKTCQECEYEKYRRDCMTRSILTVPIDKIEYIPDPSREETDETLDSSIKTKGILQPIITSYEEGKYKLIFGGRRYQAAVNLGLKEIPVVVRETDDLDRIVLRLHENVHRKDYSLAGLAKALMELRDKHGMKQKEIAKALGKSDGWVSNVFSTSKLPESVKEKLDKGEVKMGVDRASKLARMPEKKAEKLVDKGATKEEVYKEAKRRSSRLKYKLTHRGKASGVFYNMTVVFNSDDVTPEQIAEAFEQCKKKFAGGGDD